MQFIIAKQIAVEAETPEEAVAKIAEGKTISFTVSPRPTANQPLARNPAIAALQQAGTVVNMKEALAQPQPQKVG